MTAYLEDWGYRVDCVSGGVEALERILGEEFDLVLLDIYMEDLSGLDVLQEIRKRPDLADLPVVMVSSEQDPSSMAVACDFGAADYVTKPVDPQWFRAKVERNLRSSPAHQGALAPGQQLGRYQIKSLLTTSVGCQVYLAQDLRLQRLVRLKQFTGVNQVEVADREALTLACIRHPNVAAIHDVSSGPLTYIVTEYAGGRTLAAPSRLDCPRALIQPIKWTMEILDGLRAVHEQGVVHANLTTESVCLTDDGRIQLTDFTQAYRPDTLTENRGIASNPLAAFAAPEQVDPIFGPIGPRADLFAAAGLLHFLVTGSAPFTPRLPSQQLLSIAFAHSDSMTGKNPYLPCGIEEVCVKGLQKDQAGRFQTAREFRDALRPQLAQAIRTGQRVMR